MKDFLFLVWYLSCRYIFIMIPDRLFFQLTSWVTHMRLGFKFSFLNLNTPQSFNEKLNYLKALPLNAEHTMLADKVLVRDYIKQTIGEKYLIPVLGVYKQPEEIDFDKLPQSFILKTNHGSGWNLICKDKSVFNKNKAIKLFKRWLSFNAYFLSREKQYKSIKPLILCEQLLKYEIYDYKFFCFDGKPEFVQVDIDRFTNHKRVFFDMKWGKQPFSIRYEIFEKTIPKPPHLEEMISVSCTLSKNLKFCRVDLYVHDNKVYFGEITLIPGGGNEPFLPQTYDKEIGNYLKID